MLHLLLVSIRVMNQRMTPFDPKKELISLNLQNSSKTYTKIMLNSAYIETLMEEKILIES